jgi:hypothetical protein
MIQPIFINLIFQRFVDMDLTFKKVYLLNSFVAFAKFDYYY